MLEALEEPLDVICEATHSVLEKTPPELAADVGEMGIVITGGGAYLRGLDNAYRSGPGSGQSWRQTRICASPEEQENHLNI